MPYSIRPFDAAPDTRCPDGFACYGWRQVHKGGYVRWYGSKYYHNELAQWAGMWVYIEISDWLAIDLNVFPGGFPRNSKDEYLVAKTRLEKCDENHKINPDND